MLEVFPAVIALPVLVLTRKTFPLKPLSYFLILIHAWILLIGGHYTYARVPFFDTIGEWFDWVRNNYDKVGHFAQGFVPALLTREILIQKEVIKRRTWLPFLVSSISVAISAAYELMEWWVSVFSGTAGDDFLDTQGYVWDTQSDMFLALIGAVTSLTFLSRLHSRQLRSIGNERAVS